MVRLSLPALLGGFMNRKKSVSGLLLLFDAHKEFTLDEFLNLVQDLVGVQIKHGRLQEKNRDSETAYLMGYWHRAPYAEHADVISIEQSS
jgi:hypothetical protein